MMRKIILIISVITLIIITMGCKEDNTITGKAYNPESCEDPYPIGCDFSGETIDRSEKIPCKTHEDCKPAKMKGYCSPGIAELSGCDNDKFFCGSDGYCRGCECFD
jgi:hypothetical protein